MPLIDCLLLEYFQQEIAKDGIIFDNENTLDNYTLITFLVLGSLHVRSLCSFQGKRHLKSRSFSHFALHRDGSSMVFHKLRDNIQAHSEAWKGALMWSNRPIEALKDFL